MVFAAQHLGAEADASQPAAMMRAVTGEVLPVSDAMKVNYLESYKARYPVFPAVLEGSRWVSTLKTEENCTSNPRKVWTFTADGEFGHICQMTSPGAPMVYQCEEKRRFGRNASRNYKVRFGDKNLPDWTLDRPHITLERESWPHKVISLQMCLI